MTLLPVSRIQAEPASSSAFFRLAAAKASTSLDWAEAADQREPREQQAEKSHRRKPAA